MAEKKTASKKSKTPQSLVIVESPAKAHTIEKYLGRGRSRTSSAVWSYRRSRSKSS